MCFALLLKMLIMMLMMMMMSIVKMLISVDDGPKIKKKLNFASATHMCDVSCNMVA